MPDDLVDEPAPDLIPIGGTLGGPPAAPHVLGPPPWTPGYGQPPNRLIRAAGAEHALPAIEPLPINPVRLQHLDAAQVDAVVDAVEARSLAHELERHRPEQAPAAGVPNSNSRTR